MANEPPPRPSSFSLPPRPGVFPGGAPFAGGGLGGLGEVSEQFVVSERP